MNHLYCLALLLESKRKKEKKVPAQSYNKALFLSSPYTYASKIFIRPLPLQGENNEFCMASLQRQKCQVCEEDWHCGAPQNPLQTPRKEPRLKLLWEERRCLPASSRLCYSIFMCGFFGGGLIKCSKKSNSKHLPFWIWRPVWCVQGCTVMEKITGTPLCSLLWCRELVPL